MLDSRREAALAAQAAQRGMNFLDMFHGGSNSWAGRIDVASIDIAHDDTCMIGQLTGSYKKTIAFHDLDKSPAHFGFQQSEEVGFSALTVAWKKLIHKSHMRLKNPQLLLTR